MDSDKYICVLSSDCENGGDWSKAISSDEYLPLVV